MGCSLPKEVHHVDDDHRFSTLDPATRRSAGAGLGHRRWAGRARPAPASAVTGDADADGLDDGLEDTLATRFFPHVWFDSGEDAGCTHPATTSGNPGTALARVRTHPNDPAKIAIQYVILYRYDCGDIGGLTSHYGDVEPFAITLAPNPACPHGWGAWALKTVAHEGAPGQHTDQRFLGNDCYWGRVAGASPHVARIFASENKHGNYASEDSCDGALLGLENCSTSFTLPFNVYNVGEDHPAASTAWRPTSSPASMRGRVSPSRVAREETAAAATPGSSATSSSTTACWPSPTSRRRRPSATSRRTPGTRPRATTSTSPRARTCW